MLDILDSYTEVKNHVEVVSPLLFFRRGPTSSSRTQEKAILTPGQRYGPCFWEAIAVLSMVRKIAAFLTTPHLSPLRLCLRALG